MKYLLIIILATFNYNIQAQDLAIGQWRSHLPYTSAVSVTQSNEAIYFAGTESVFSLDKTDYSVELFNKVTGLSDAGIQRINFNKNNDILFIAYKNSNIDLVHADNSIVNISAIKDEGITGDSRIYHIRFQDQFAWLSTGFGIVKLDMENAEIRFTTFSNLQMNSTAIYDDMLYASTEDGLYRVDLNTTELYQANFSNWEKIDETQGLPSAYYSNVSETFSDKLYADVNDSLYVYDGNEWSFFHYENNFTFATLHAGNSRLIASLAREVGVDKVILFAASGATYSITTGEVVGESAESIEDENDIIWVADQFRGMTSFDPSNFEIQKYDVNGPFDSSVGEIIIHNDEVWVASASVKPLWQRRDNSKGFYQYAQNTWSNYNVEYDPLLGEKQYRDFITIAVRPTDERVFVGSYTGGLVEFDGTAFTLYNDTNSSLQKPIGDDFSVRISGLAFDRYNTLWMSNYAAPEPIAALEPDGTWHTFAPPFSYPFPTQVVVDFNGYKWFAGGQAAEGFLVFDDGGTLNDTSDDRYQKIDKSNSVMESDGIKSLALDLDGNMWVGTGAGLVVFECTGQIFSDSGCAGRQPVFEEDEDEEYLFKDVAINTIAIDGANQKWVGTNVGLFLLDENVKNTLLEFNTQNSPIFSDEIIDIAINGNTGEVFVATGGGIISYRAEATDGRSFFKDVYAYPNPVRPEYTGKIAIKGLVENANIKITDVSGTLVYESTALGGQAIWDGNDYNGRRAASGVYLVYATAKDGLESMVTKVLMMN